MRTILICVVAAALFSLLGGCEKTIKDVQAPTDQPIALHTPPAAAV